MATARSTRAGSTTAGRPKRYEGDDDFDGRFEWMGDASRGRLVTSTLDSNGDGNPDAVMHVEHGVLRSVDVYDEAGKRVVARQHLRRRLLE